MSESEDSRKQWQISVLSQTAKDPLSDIDIEAFMKDLVTNRCIDTLLEDFAADKCIDTLLEDFMAENEISLVSRKILVAPKAKVRRFSVNLWKPVTNFSLYLLSFLTRQVSSLNFLSFSPVPSSYLSCLCLMSLVLLSSVSFRCQRCRSV